MFFRRHVTLHDLIYPGSDMTTDSEIVYLAVYPVKFKDLFPDISINFQKFHEFLRSS